MIQFVDDGNVIAEWETVHDYTEATHEVAEKAVRAMMHGEWSTGHTNNMLNLMTAIDRMCGYKSYIVKAKADA